ncbi:hypothetical protein B9T16_24940, partial [Arthrospira sp. PCC 8006]|uniref:hypothetical protein n=1 Tax=Arthrospira sp. PCC 8006 TaxID=1982224 RepID=UPI00396F110C
IIKCSYSQALATPFDRFREQGGGELYQSPYLHRGEGLRVRAILAILPEINISLQTKNWL